MANTKRKADRHTLGNDMRRLTIEATKADGSYQVVWVGSSFENALEFLQKSTLKERLKLWSKEHAESPKGFCPMAYREAGSEHILIAGTLKMLMGTQS